MYLILTASKDNYITNKIIDNTLSGESKATASVTGVSATATPGTTTTITENIFLVTGVAGTSAAGTASVSGKATVDVTGVSGTCETNDFTLVWGLIDTAQDPKWTRIVA